MEGFITGLTSDGIKLLLNAMNGQRLEFTSITLGAGKYTGPTTAISACVDPKITLPLKSIVVKNNKATLQSVLSYNDIEDGFTWTEYTVNAVNLDTEEEISYGYAYWNGTGNPLPAKGSTSLKEIVLTVTVAVSDALTVTAQIDNTRVWATLADLAKINDVIPLTHTVDSGIHIFTGLTREGLVPIQFAATADYTAGQTLTIDSVRYTVALSSGDTPNGIVWKAGTKQLGLCDSTNQTLIIIQSPDNVPAHNVDPEAHPDIRALLSNHEGRITRLENILLSDITGNPFLITFEDLNGLVVTGTWNQAQARMEF